MELGWYIEMAVKKATEGGIGSSTFLNVTKPKILKKRGINARTYTYPSPFVGYTSLVIEAKTKKDMIKVIRIVKQYGYDFDIRNAIKL